MTNMLPVLHALLVVVFHHHGRLRPDAHVPPLVPAQKVVLRLLTLNKQEVLVESSQVRLVYIKLRGLLRL